VCVRQIGALSSDISATSNASSAEIAW
jgi:hypothetical protein